MVTDEFAEIVKEIKEHEKEFSFTPRRILMAFSCEKRTKGNQARINKFLQENQLETEPDFTSGWMDGEIILKHKQRAKSKNEKDPIQRIKVLQAANKELVSISRDTKLKEAITLMMLHNYSQLPVMNGPRNVIGFVNWETIGCALTNGCESEDIKNYISKDISILDYETPLLDAIKIVIKKDFALVQKSDKSISGIVTIADISTQFLNITEPFLLLEQVENHLRLILDKKFLIEELREFCRIGENERVIEYIDDLNFGDYIFILSNPDNWEKINLSIERSHFINQLNKIRAIRNDIMHFDPEGITEEQREDLVKMANFLMMIKKLGDIK